MEPSSQHPSRPLISPMVSAALYTAVDTVTLSKLPEEDQENILLMADVFHRILCQVIDTLDPYGEKFHQYKHLFTIDYLDRHWKDMRSEISKILEEFRVNSDEEADSPDPPAQPPSVKLRAAEQPLLKFLDLTPRHQRRIEMIFKQHYQTIDALAENNILVKGFIGIILNALTPEESARVMALIRKTAEKPTNE